MITGVNKKPVPYVLEDDRNSPLNEQTVFWITPKKGHDANETLRRYAGAGRDGRKGYRELNTAKLDAADIEEFLSCVSRVQNFKLAEEEGGKVLTDITAEGDLKQVCRSLSPDHLNEIFDAANNQTHLKAGEKKTPTSDILRVMEE